MNHITSITLNQKTKRIFVKCKYTELYEKQFVIPVYTTRLSPKEERPVASRYEKAIKTSHKKHTVEEIVDITTEQWLALRDSIIANDRPHRVEVCGDDVVVWMTDKWQHGARTLQQIKERKQEVKNKWLN